MVMSVSPLRLARAAKVQNEADFAKIASLVGVDKAALLEVNSALVENF